MKPKTTIGGPLFVLIAGAVVGALAWRGTFTSVMGFPWIFGAVCLVFGMPPLLRKPRFALPARAACVVVGSSLAIAGGFAQQRLVERRYGEIQVAAFAALGGKPAAPLTGLKPINVEAAVLSEASSFSSKATIVTFWARWCSPCRKDLPELNEFYEAHKDKGLAVVAVTRYKSPDDDVAREAEFAKAGRYVKDLGLTFPAGIAMDSQVHTAYQVRALPSVALIDSAGRIVAYRVGYDSDKELLRQALALLSE